MVPSPQRTIMNSISMCCTGRFQVGLPASSSASWYPLMILTNCCQCSFRCSKMSHGRPGIQPAHLIIFWLHWLLDFEIAVVKFPQAVRHLEDGPRPFFVRDVILKKSALLDFDHTLLDFICRSAVPLEEYLTNRCNHRLHTPEELDIQKDEGAPELFSLLGKLERAERQRLISL